MRIIDNAPKRSFHCEVGLGGLMVVCVDKRIALESEPAESDRAHFDSSNLPFASTAASYFRKV